MPEASPKRNWPTARNAAPWNSWTNSAGSRRLAYATAHVVAAVVALGFLVPPLAIFFRLVK